MIYYAAMLDIWRRCSSCKSEILQGSPYYVCSVSTCQQKRTNYAFCSVECWDQHIPVERHRGDSVAAIEKRAPMVDESQESASPNSHAPAQRRTIVTSGGATSAPASSRSGTSVDGEILVVASKVKKYIADRSGMNTSASAFEALTDRIRWLCDKAIEKAREDGRKTVMDRDIP